MSPHRACQLIQCFLAILSVLAVLLGRTQTPDFLLVEHGSMSSLAEDWLALVLHALNPPRILSKAEYINIDWEYVNIKFWERSMAGSNALYTEPSTHQLILL